jgi:hypothetical protein
VAQDICLQTQSPASQVSINCHHLSHTFLHEFLDCNGGGGGGTG